MPAVARIAEAIMSGVFVIWRWRVDEHVSGKRFDPEMQVYVAVGAIDMKAVNGLSILVQEHLDRDLF